MADQLAKRDQNSNASLLALENNAALEIRNLLVDPSSKGLLVHIAGGASSADGAITDGADANIKATVKDFTNSNPLAVAVMDANGDIITSFGSNPVGITGSGGGAIKDDTAFGENLTSGILSVAQRLWDGAAYDRAPGNSTDGALVNLGANNDVTVTGDALTALQLIDDPVFADDAGFTAGTHKVMMQGKLGVAVGSDPDAADANDAAAPIMTRHRQPFILGGHPNLLTLEAAYTAAQTNAAIITQGTGGKIVVTQIHITADNANTVDVGFRVGFGTANTPTTTKVVASHPGLAAGSGLVIGDGSGIIGIGADDEDLRITSEVPTTGSLRVVVKYFILPT